MIFQFLILFCIILLWNAFRQGRVPGAKNTSEVKNYTDKQSPVVINDQSLFLSLPFIGDIRHLWRILSSGFENYLAQETAKYKNTIQLKSNRHPDIVTFYFLGKYITFIYDKKADEKLHNSREDMLSFDVGIGYILDDLMPQLYISYARFEWNAAKEILESFSPRRRPRIFDRIQSSCDLALYNRKWFSSSLSSKHVEKDFFNAIYFLSLELNIHIFLENVLSTQEKETRDRFSQLFCESDVERTNLANAWIRHRLKLSAPMDQAYYKMMELCRPAIEKRIGEFEEYNSQHDHTNEDYLNILVRKGLKLNPKDKVQAVFGGLYAFFLGAQANTYSTLSWVTIQLLSCARSKDPEKREIYERFRKEVDDAPNPLTCEYVEQNMSFTDSCIRESIRFATPCYSFLRRVICDGGIKVPLERENDLHLPKGNFVIMRNHMKDESIAGKNTERWDPLRLERYSQQIDEKESRKLLKVWGSGTHVCKGKDYAYLQIRTVLVKLFRDCDMELLNDDNGLEPSSRNLIGISHPREPVKIQFK